MKNYIILFIIFLSFITFAYSGLFEYDLLGGTQLNGSGCVCHTVERDTSVSVWIEGPDTLRTGQTGYYRMYLANGPAEAGGYNVAGRFGTMVLVDTLSYWHYLSPNELTQAFPLVFPTPQDTIYWEFAYTAPDSVVIDTLYSCGLSLVYDHIPDFLDRWNFGTKFPITVIENIVPVEFISFTSSVASNDVKLNWTTATEANNMGFNVERKQVSSLPTGQAGLQPPIGYEEWKVIAFINGSGTTTESKIYSFEDNDLNNGNYQYRLKQIDFDGTFEYSSTIEVEITSPNKFSLEQNFPNPFNPATVIRYSIPNVISIPTGQERNPNVVITVYDIIGNEVAVLVDEYKTAGSYEVDFNVAHESLRAIASGIYFYRLQAGSFVQTRKMVLLK